MNEQTRTISLAAGAPAATAPEDAWDRLAALAFGDAASEGGCSEHAFDCTCLAAHGAAEAVASAMEETTQPQEATDVSSAASSSPASVLAPTITSSTALGSEAPVPDPERPIDPEADPAYPAPEVVPDPDRPVFPEPEPGPVPDPDRPVLPEPEPIPPLTPEPEAEELRASESGV
ncbi:MAG TPA: hypothetical protein VH372_22575 [Actinospica sp.]|jgi:DNA polymerase-3 subunit gamma/tau|nr:hypothetical protein [Actinospica sp.]